MKKRILAFILVIALMFSVAPTSMADTSTSAKEGLVLDKTATYDNETGIGKITLSSYVKGSVESTPTDVVLVIDHSGSMWTAVDSEKVLTFEDFKNDTSHGKREGYYIAISKNKQNVGDNQKSYVAHLIRYANNRWEISKRFFGNGRDADTHPNTASINANDAFINTTIGSDRQWEPLTTGIANTLNFYKSISGALYDALNVFMEEMENAVNCRVAITTFAGSTNKYDHSNLNAEDDYIGSGIFINEALTWDSTVPTLSDADYENAFEDPTTTTGKTILTNTVNKINTDYGSTPTAMGLLYARRLFIEAGRANANKVAIVFTDGIPSPEDLKTRGHEDNCTHTAANYNQDANSIDCPYCNLYEYNDANGNKQYKQVTTYVDQAKELKTAQGATVYSIGPTAGRAGVDVLNNIASTRNHFYSVGDGDLQKVFHDIAGVIVASSQELNKNSVLVDEMTKSFELPKGVTTNDIKVYTAKYKGVDSKGKDIFDNPVIFNDAKITLDTEKNIVKVSNFDYKSEAVYMAGDNPNGSKLIVEIPFKPTPDFLGGDDVLTNTSNSGIYNNETCVDKFPLPNVDVNVSKIKPLCISKDIYLSQQASLPEVIKLGEYNQNGGDWKVNSINNAYVDIMYTVTDEDGNSMTYTIPAGTAYDALTDIGWSENADTHPLLKKDTTYTVECTVVSTNNDSNTETDINEAVIRVYKPEITFQDSVIYNSYTENYPENHVSVIWKHDGTEADSNKMGEAPTLEYTYSPEAGAFTKDTPVQVMTVTAKKDATNNVPINQDIIKYVTFYREDCSYSECDWGNEHEEKAVVEHVDTTTGNVKSSYVNFVVHAPTNNLEITKNVTGNMGNLNKEFEFKIELSKSFEKTDVQNETTTEVKILNIVDSTNIGDFTVNSDDGILVEKTENDGVYIFKLKDDQSITFTVPYGTEYKITEADCTQQGYKTFISVDTEDSENEMSYESREIKKHITSDTSIVYTNNKDVPVDTGIDNFSNSNRIILCCLIVIFAVMGEVTLYKVYKRRRIR